MPVDHQRLAAQRLSDPRLELARCQRLGQRADQADRPRITGLQRPLDTQTKQGGQLRVVAHLWMHIQGQMVGQQRNIMAQQGFQAALFHAHDTGILVLPEVAMMHQHHIRLCLDRSIQKCLAGGHAADDPSDLRPPFDLQSVGAVIGDPGGIEKPVRLLYQGGECYWHGFPFVAAGAQQSNSATESILRMKLHFGRSFV